MAGLQLAAQVHIPLERVVTVPPAVREGAMCDEFAVHVQPAFIEQAREKRSNLVAEEKAV